MRSECEHQPAGQFPHSRLPLAAWPLLVLSSGARCIAATRHSEPCVDVLRCCHDAASAVSAVGSVRMQRCLAQHTGATRARSSSTQARARCSTSRRVSARESSLVYSPSVRTRASPQRALSTIDAASLDDSGSPAKEPLHTVVCCMVHESRAASRRTYKPNGFVAVSGAARAVRVAVRVRRVTDWRQRPAVRCCFVSGHHAGSAGYCSQGSTAS